MLRRTSFYLAISYFSAIFLLSLRDVCFQLDNVPFGYALYFKCSDILESFWIVVLQIASFVFGYIILNFSLRFPHIRIPKFRFGKNATSYFPVLVAVQILISLYFLYVLISDFDQYLTQNTNLPRILTSKVTPLLVLSASLISIYCISKRRNRSLSFLVIFFLSFIFSWFEGSRTALIPVALLFAFYVSEKKIVGSIFSLILILFIYVFTEHSRWSTDLSFFTFYSILFDSIKSIFTLKLNFSYLFQFSYLHVLYVLDNFKNMFSLGDVLYSITPIPNAYLNQANRALGWRVDAARSFGAIASLLMYSNIAFSVYSIILGFLSRRIDRLSNRIRFTAALIIFSLVLISSYQYSLRATQWFIYLLFVITLSRNPTASKNVGGKIR